MLREFITLRNNYDKLFEKSVSRDKENEELEEEVTLLKKNVAQLRKQHWNLRRILSARNKSDNK